LKGILTNRIGKGIALVFEKLGGINGVGNDYLFKPRLNDGALFLGQLLDQIHLLRVPPTPSRRGPITQ